VEPYALLSVYSMGRWDRWSLAERRARNQAALGFINAWFSAYVGGDDEGALSARHIITSNVIACAGVAKLLAVTAAWRAGRRGKKIFFKHRMLQRAMRVLLLCSSDEKTFRRSASCATVGHMRKSCAFNSYLYLFCVETPALAASMPLAGG